jgi:hypothetical protein
MAGIRTPDRSIKKNLEHIKEKADSLEDDRNHWRKQAESVTLLLETDRNAFCFVYTYAIAQTPTKQRPYAFWGLPAFAFEAKKVAPNYDVYYLERDFREWLSNIGKPAPDNLTKAFVGFCKARHKRKPHP